MSHTHIRKSDNINHNNSQIKVCSLCAATIRTNLNCNSNQSLFEKIQKKGRVQYDKSVECAGEREQKKRKLLEQRNNYICDASLTIIPAE